MTFLTYKNDARYWIGANDIDKEDDWVWEWDESKIVFDCWHDGEPNNNGDEDCVEIKWQNSLYKWNDQQCEYKYFYICEK